MGFSIARLDKKWGVRILRPGQEMATCSGAATRFEGDFQLISEKHVQHEASHEEFLRYILLTHTQIRAKLPVLATTEGLLTVLKHSCQHLYSSVYFAYLGNDSIALTDWTQGVCNSIDFDDFDASCLDDPQRLQPVFPPIPESIYKHTFPGSLPCWMGKSMSLLRGCL